MYDYHSFDAVHLTSALAFFGRASFDAVHLTSALAFFGRATT